ncbi:nucleotidyltransferase domain-containing protein [Stenotrophomonas sepilia]|uniref:nucleotidyltransferase domain-containing protein n=1 Tax=Stenotrophomonas sepilia TaxID=2860290 RepID=UPI003555CC87
MNASIHIFGSITRGEAALDSDVDVLVVSDAKIVAGCYPAEWSVYRTDVLREKFIRGDLFAWHLALDARCVYAPDGQGHVKKFGLPSPYVRVREDISLFRAMLETSLGELRGGSSSRVFELGICHTALRDIAMSASYHLFERPNFSRYSPFHMPVEIGVSREAYEISVKARHASTRGATSPDDIEFAISEFLDADLIRWAGAVERAI